MVVAVVNGANHNLQRPETVETLMYLWRVTKKRKWRDAGWEIIQAFNRCCKIESGGYVGLRDVTNAVRSQPNPQQGLVFFCSVEVLLTEGLAGCGQNSAKDDTQQSFWLAETLKYLYLLFSPDEASPPTTFTALLSVHVLIWGFA